MLRPVVLIILIFMQTACSTYHMSSDPYIVGMRWFDRKYFDHAKNIWEPMANASDCDAQYRMGTLYFLGTGVSKDYKIAHKWFSSAANQGQAFAQHLLATMYAHGYTEIHTVEMKMAFNCLSGCDYEKNMMTAYQWEQLAIKGTPYEPYRDHVMKVTLEKIKKELTPEQVAKADSFVRSWQPTPNQCQQRQVR